MRSMFRVCATERLFIPDMFPAMDRAIYIDTDLIFLRWVGSRAGNEPSRSFTITERKHLKRNFNKLRECSLSALDTSVTQSWRDRDEMAHCAHPQYSGQASRGPLVILWRLLAKSRGGHGAVSLPLRHAEEQGENHRTFMRLQHCY